MDGWREGGSGISGMVGTHDETTRQFFEGTKVECVLRQRLGGDFVIFTIPPEFRISTIFIIFTIPPEHPQFPWLSTIDFPLGGDPAVLSQVTAHPPTTRAHIGPGFAPTSA